MHSQSNATPLRLCDLSEAAQQTLQKAGFDLSKGINEFQLLCNYSHRPSYINPLFFAISENHLNIIQELLDKKADLNCPLEEEGPNCLMYCMTRDRYEAYELILNHPHSQTIDFNYCLENSDWAECSLHEGTVLMSAIKKVFRYEIDIENNIGWLNKLMQKKLDYNYHEGFHLTAFAYLFYSFGTANTTSNQLSFSYFKDTVEKFIAGGADLNCIDNDLEHKLQAPVGNLFCMEEYEQDDIGFNARRRKNFLIILNLLLNQLEDIKLKRLASMNGLDEDKNSCLSIAMQFQLNNVTNKLLSEIRIQALKKILQFKTMQDNYIESKQANQKLEKKLVTFIHSHALKDDEAAHKLLDEKVVPSVLSMLNPKKSLREIVYSDKIRKKLEKDGFDLNGDFKQKSRNNSDPTDLLKYAAMYGLKGLVVGLLLQPSFANDYSLQQIFDAIITSIYSRNLAIVPILTSVLFSKVNDSSVIYPMLKAALTESAHLKNARLMKHFTELYKTLGGPNNFSGKLMEDKRSLTWLNSALQCNDSTYMTDQVRHLFLHHGISFAPNKKYPLETRLQEYYKSHFNEPTVPSPIMDIISSIVGSFKHHGRTIFKARLCANSSTLFVPLPSDKKLERTVSLPSDVIFNILCFLEEKDKIKKYAAESVCSWYPTYVANRKAALNPVQMQTAEVKSQNSGKRKTEAELTNKQPTKKAKGLSSQSLFSSSSSSNSNNSGSSSNTSNSNPTPTAVPMDQSDAVDKNINGMSKSG